MGGVTPGANRAGWISARAASVAGIFRLLVPFAGLALVILVWEAASRLELVIPFLLPAPSVVAARVATDLVSGSLLVDAALTLYRALAGFALAAVLGVAIGVLMSRVAWVRWLFDPLVSIGLPMPKIAMLPVFMVWFGMFDVSKIRMAAFSAVFTIIIATWSGAQTVDKQLVWSAQSLGASNRQALWEVVMPAALPQVLTGLQVAMPLCLIVVLVCEMTMGGQGLGEATIRSARYADSPGVFAGIIEIAATGFIVIKFIEAIRRRILVWHQETAREAMA